MHSRSLSVSGARWSVVAVASAILAAACGGLSDLGNDIADGFTCGLAGCKPSDGLASSSIAPDYTVTSSGAEVLVTAGFRTSGGANHDVQLTTDKLSVETDGAPAIPFRDDLLQLEWSAVFPTASASRKYSIAFVRRDGSTLTSGATLPPAFALLSPTTPLGLDRRSATVPITVSAPATEQLIARMSGTCGSATHAFGVFPFAAPMASGSGSSYTLDPAAMYSFLGSAVTPSTTNCDLKLTLSRELPGTLAPGFRTDGRSIGRFEHTIRIQFDTS